MELKSQAFGPYSTNAYILTNQDQSLIIDPGMGAVDWVISQVQTPVAILNTHGHWDHVWSNQALQEKLQIPIYAPEADTFLLADEDQRGTPPSTADYAVKADETLQIGPFSVTFYHFPGHTPGCSMIQIGQIVFSGDMIFKGSIGRYDFPYSSAKEMLASLEKFAQWEENLPLYPGHGTPTTTATEQALIPQWQRLVRQDIAKGY